MHIPIAIGFIFMTTYQTYAQDIHFSQFAQSPLNLNPAQTGLFDGDQRFVANHRNQWKSVTTPFVTFSGSFETALDRLSPKNTRLAAGVLFNNDRAGDSQMGTNSLLGSFSILKPLNSDSIHFLGFGASLGVTMRNINYSALTFDEQYDGDVYNPSVSNTENFENDSHTFFDLGLGFNYVFNHQSGLSFGLGSGLMHLNQPNDGFFGTTAKVNVKWQNNISAIIPVASKVQLLPSGMLASQGSYNEMLIGTSAQYVFSELPGRQYAFSAGIWLRTGDAVIPYLGIRYNELRFGLSYDVNTSDLDRASNGNGGYELSMSYIIKKVKSKGIKPPCPLY
jgi:type IX secretion system PorP/SprF family membrane protein